MKKISTGFHAVLDYASALVFLVAPWLFNFDHVPAAKTIVLATAILVLVVSFLTRYEGGFLNLIPMKAHLLIDVLLGLFLIVSPWFKDEVFLFFIVMGMVAVIAGTFTRGQSGAPVPNG